MKGNRFAWKLYKTIVQQASAEVADAVVRFDFRATGVPITLMSYEDGNGYRCTKMSICLDDKPIVIRLDYDVLDQRCSFDAPVSKSERIRLKLIFGV